MLLSRSNDLCCNEVMNSVRFPLIHAFLPRSPDEPIASTPTHEADQEHMLGAEEAPPTLNPIPAVVPSPDDSASIDPSYNPNGEELLYEGDIEAEQPLPKVEKEASSQDEGFMISVHVTGMELDMAESLSGSHSKAAGTKADVGSGKHSSSSPHWRSNDAGGKGARTTPSSKSSLIDAKSSSSPRKDLDRFVSHYLPPPSPLPLPNPDFPNTL